MKLIDLLVKELPRRGGWPEGAESVVQDADDSGFYFFTGGPVKNGGKSWWFVDSDSRNDNSKWIFFEGKNDIADDCNSAIVTRTQYEAALAASDDWIEWHGGKCPVDSDAIVEVRYRKPNPYQFNNDRAGDFNWSHDGFDGDIIAYRLQKPQQEEQPEAGEEDMNECIGQAPVAEWNGEGIPPVGCECEYLNSNGEWSTVKVKYSSDQLIVISGAAKILGEEQETEIAKDIIIDKPKFRPLRTEAEKAREDAETAIRTCLAGTGAGITPLAAKGIYEAIAAGKIPGVKLEEK